MDFLLNFQIYDSGGNNQQFINITNSRAVQRRYALNRHIMSYCLRVAIIKKKYIEDIVIVVRRFQFAALLQIPTFFCAISKKIYYGKMREYLKLSSIEILF